jgi:predicted small integral membrane protein
LLSPPKNVPAQLAGLDQTFANKEALTLAHILPGLAFVILVPFQLSRSWRSRHLRAHRWMGRIVMILCLIIAISALAMSTQPIGGAVEASATIFFDLLFLFALTKAYLHIRRREIVLHREWVIRAMSIALGIATVRPIMGAFFATSRVTGLTPHDFFGIAFWIGFSLTYLVGEIWIHYTRVSVKRTPMQVVARS